MHSMTHFKLLDNECMIQNSITLIFLYVNMNIVVNIFIHIYIYILTSPSYTKIVYKIHYSAPHKVEFILCHFTGTFRLPHIISLMNIKCFIASLPCRKPRFFWCFASVKCYHNFYITLVMCIGNFDIR
jgi:hypothetical protein